MTVRSPIVALLTPFATGGRIDFGALEEYLGYLAESGVTTILANGTTGEFAALTLGERRKVLEFCRLRWRGHLIGHVGATCAQDALELLDHATDYADSVVALPPYYFAEPPEAGLESFFRSLLGHRDHPFFLYNFPRHTQAPLSPQLVLRLRASFPHLLGLKDSGKDPNATRGFIDVGGDFAVFLGADSAAARYRDVGARGIVTGGGNAVVRLPVAIEAALERGDTPAACALQERFDLWSEARRHSGTSEIAFVKAGMGAQLPGFPCHVRPPLVAVSQLDVPAIARIATRATAPP